MRLVGCAGGGGGGRDCYLLVWMGIVGAAVGLSVPVRVAERYVVRGEDE